MSFSHVYPVVLCGGAGMRLWPLSRTQHGKQFTDPMNRELSLLQETVERLQNLQDLPNIFPQPILLNNQENRFLLAHQMKEIGITPLSHILEPVRRNTAASILTACFFLQNLKENKNKEILALFMPSDHIITNNQLFMEHVMNAAPLALKDRVIVFGIKPSYPETGYGYIATDEKDEAEDALTSTCRIRCFVEKPSIEKATIYAKNPAYFWNSGILLVKPSFMIQLFKRFMPSTFLHTKKAFQAAHLDFDFLRLKKSYYERNKNISIDVGIMEKIASSTSMVKLDTSIGWDDLGTWNSVYNFMDKDANKNSIHGRVVAIDTKESCIYNDGHGVIATLGVNNTVIVNTQDAFLVASRDRAQDVEKITKKLLEENYQEAIDNKKVNRPWGFYEVIRESENFNIKRLSIYPKQSISLQLHHKRREHWLVICGEAAVQIGDERYTLHENESVDVKMNVKHRVQNNTNNLLEIIEIQTGLYFGEDDIVRYADEYGRLEDEFC